MVLLKLMLVPYLGLGMFTGVACSRRSAWHPGLNGYLVLGAIHVLLIGGAFILTTKSERRGTGLSRGGLGIGLALAYIAGLLIPLFA